MSNATFARRGIAGLPRSRRAVVTQAGKNSAASRSSPGGSRLAKPITTSQDPIQRVTAMIAICRSALICGR